MARGPAGPGEGGEGIDVEAGVDVDCGSDDEAFAACVLRAAVAEPGPGEVVGADLRAEWARKAARKL